MKKFTDKDIEDYYDQTELHYRMWWKLEEVMGLHYGIWDKSTKSLPDAILNTNYLLMTLGEIKSSDAVLDCGCGIGGSAIYLAKKLGCKVTGVTLSAKQAGTATKLAVKNSVEKLLSFHQLNYLETGFADNSFDIIWAIESFGSSSDKQKFFKEMHRILRPGGKILFADTFKPYTYDIRNEKTMQLMLNCWAITDILSIDELKEMSEANGFETPQIQDHTKGIKKSVDRIYLGGKLGLITTKVHNFFKLCSYFSRVHYKSAFAQKKAYQEGKWGYYLVSIQKKNT